MKKVEKYWRQQSGIKVTSIRKKKGKKKKKQDPKSARNDTMGLDVIMRKKNEKNLKPSTIHKNRSNHQQPQNNLKNNPTDIASLRSDFGIDFIKLIDGYIHECNLNITIFTGISELIYSYTLMNLVTGCWVYHVRYSGSYYSDSEYKKDHNYSLQIHDYSFRLNRTKIDSEQGWPLKICFTALEVFSLKGYIEMDKNGRYIMLLEYKSGLEFLKKKSGLINHKQREKVYFQRIMNVYKYLNYDDLKLLKMHKKYKSNKGILNWECVSQKLFHDLKYGKFDIKPKKSNKMVEKMPDMHVLYKKLCIFHGINPLGMYVGNMYIKCNKDYSSAKIRFNEKDFFRNEVQLTVLNDVNNMLTFWRECLGKVYDEKDKQKIKQIIDTILI
eukprot:30037_1